MNGNTPFSNDSRQSFIFHGKGLSYFNISLVNILLSIVTLGIYVPWAMVRSRRYVYENLELNGARFGYHASGGALFLSWFLLVVFYIFIGVFENIFPPSGSLAFIFLIIISPFLIIKSLQYNALMTTLNNIRFGFHCSMKSAWWIMMGLPVLLIIALGVIIFGMTKVIFNDYDGMIYKIVLLMIVSMVGLSAINGYVYAKWLSLTGKGGSFGIHKFDIRVSYQHCIKSCLLSFAILVPFIVVNISLIAPLFKEGAI
ncbi:YjgN family protein [Phytobacter sp. V91]|uniref:YjgN family protein n=1 Tax=Phytobacter sp. V91 TaxID=3369425 RepID=UPI003F608AD4